MLAERVERFSGASAGDVACRAVRPQDSRRARPIAGACATAREPSAVHTTSSSPPRPPPRGAYYGGRSQRTFRRSSRRRVHPRGVNVPPAGFRRRSAARRRIPQEVRLAVRAKGAEVGFGHPPQEKPVSPLHTAVKSTTNASKIAATAMRHTASIFAARDFGGMFEGMTRTVAQHETAPHPSQPPLAGRRGRALQPRRLLTKSAYSQVFNSSGYAPPALRSVSSTTTLKDVTATSEDFRRQASCANLMAGYIFVGAAETQTPCC